MNGTSPTGIQDMTTGLKQITDINQATEYFEQDFEEGPIAATGAGQLAHRQAYAQQALQQYGGTAVTTSSTSSSSSSGCGGSTTGSANCNGSSVSGNAKIACDVLQYASLSYSQAWHSSGSVFHQKCPIIGPSCATDCSGLVNIALYDVFNNNLDETTYSEVTDTKDFQQISFAQIQPGDFIQPNPDHVEIIESVKGNTINTFAAHTAHPESGSEVGPAIYSESPSYIFLRYIGPGSSSP
jgi:cell wall-associated NlpC family hydrolase